MSSLRRFVRSSSSLGPAYSGSYSSNHHPYPSSLRCAARNVSHLLCPSSSSCVVNRRQSERVLGGAQQQTRRSFGVYDTITNMTQNQMKASAEKEFAKMIQLMGDAPVWTIGVWKSTIVDATLTGWKTWVPGYNDTKEIQDMKNIKEILDKLPEDSMNIDYKTITPAWREKLLKASGKGADEINNLIWFYKQSCIVANWIREKSVRKELLPKTNVELRLLQAHDKRLDKIAREVMGEVRMKMKKRGFRKMF